MMRLLREPLLHFFVLGAAVFFLFALVDDSPEPMAANLLEVSEDDARRLATEFTATWQRAPTPEELDAMITHFLREEVYVREALALGLDRDDAIIRRRLQTKMEFLTESGAEAVAPDEATLEAHLDANADRFTKPPRMAFEQILLDERVEDADLDVLLARLNRGVDPDAAARPTLLPAVLRLSPKQVVDGTFGIGFFDALDTLPMDVWAGPVKTSLGRHVVRVTERPAPQRPSLNEIRAQVEQDWRAELPATLREARFDALLSRYEVSLPDSEKVLGQ